MKKRKAGKYRIQPGPFSAFIFKALVLSLVHVKVSLNMILVDRFVPVSAWIMIVVLSVYSAFLVTKISDPVQSAKWRKRSWTLFSIVFPGLKKSVGPFALDCNYSKHSCYFYGTCPSITIVSDLPQIDRLFVL